MKLFKKLFSIIMAGAFVLGTSVFSTSSSDTRNYEIENSSLISNEMGGGGTPSIDEPEDEKPKVFPQPEPNEPVQNDVIIPDEDKISWVDEIQSFIVAQKEIDENFTYTLNGTGTESEPFQISSAMDLAYVSYVSQNNNQYGSGKYFKLTNDIVLNDGYFEEDGTYHDSGDGKLYEWVPISYMRGYFDGKNHKIIGVYINSSEERLGLFRYVYGQIINLEVKPSVIISSHSGGNGRVGTIAAILMNNGIISNCKTYSNILVPTSLTIHSGGIVGQTYYAERIENCVSYGQITGSNAGGIFGHGVLYHVENCDNYAKVKGGTNAGGISAYGEWTEIKGCNNYGKIIASNRAGGIIGTDEYGTTYENCTNRGNVTSTGSSAGGIVSFVYYGPGKFNNLKNFGTIYGYQVVGGIVGSGNGNKTFFNCYNEGRVITETNHSSGIIASSRDNLTMINCVNSGEINSVSSYASGMVGSGAGEIRRCVNTGVINGKSDAAGISIIFSGNIISCANYGNIYGGDIYGIVRGSFSLMKDCYNKCEFFAYKKYYGLSRDNVKYINNCIFDVTNNNKKIKKYYGSDFSGFYAKWKTGEIGLKALDNVGVYMLTMPSEEYLQSRGFEKVA